MNESIKFTADSPTGKYATDDTGVMVGIGWSNLEHTVAVVRLTDDSYVTAPLGHIEYVAAES